jgi:hypothetical protein
VTVAEPAAMAEALRERPLGWARGGGAAPEPVAALAWGRIGERLGEAFAARLAPGVRPAGGAVEAGTAHEGGARRMRA